MNSGLTSAILNVTVGSPATAGAVPSEIKEKRHHNKHGKGFVNPWDSYLERSAWEMISKLGWRVISGKRNVPNTKPPTVTVHKPKFLPTRETKSLRATWLGHACFLVEFPSGFRALFDPVFTQRCSPFASLGPKRYTEMPCEIEDIPFIDAVIISHNHYDHLSHPTILKIAKQHKNVHFFVPLGNEKWFHDCGITNVTELDWWEEREIKLSSSQPSPTTASPSPHKETSANPFSDNPTTTTSISSHPSTSTSTSTPAISAVISCLPCQHTSARTPFDKAHTLWASWSLSSGGQTLWFGGDTGYRTVPELPPSEFDYADQYSHLPTCPAFKEIGALRGPFDLGLIPIGAYDPRFIMSPMHANPYDSVNIFADTRCRRGLGIHWGTWVLTEEEVLEPPKVLREAVKWKGLEEGVFGVCDIGESREFCAGEAE